MHSEDHKKAIADLNKFLEPRHPDSVLQFITSAMVGWTHFDKTNPPSRSDVDLAWDRYLNLLRIRLDQKLSFIPSLPYPSMNEGRKVLPIPPMVYENKKVKEIVAILGTMPPNAALDFMVEVTINWCFSIPVNFLSLVPAEIPEKTDKAIADAIYTWLVRYTDLWR